VLTKWTRPGEALLIPPPACVDEQVTADEEGYVTLINTMVKRKEDGSHAYSWMAHRNAIFDVAFSDGDDLLATACGDQTVPSTLIPQP
jgi:hypothetical protein